MMVFSSGSKTARMFRRCSCRIRVEVVAEVKLLEIVVAVELLVVGVGDRDELGFVLGREDRVGVAPKVRAGHGDDVGAATGDELSEMHAQALPRDSGLETWWNSSTAIRRSSKASTP